MTDAGALSALHAAYEACKQLPVEAWRQRRKQEAKWQEALKQQLTELQTEHSSDDV